MEIGHRTFTDDAGNVHVHVGSFHRAVFRDVPYHQRSSNWGEIAPAAERAAEHEQLILRLAQKAFTEAHKARTRRRYKRKPYQPHGMTLETKRALQRGSMTPDDYNREQAIKYARWLAARDGVAIPHRLKARVVWSGFTSAYQTTRRQLWNGVKEVGVWCKRVQAVEWGHEEERYFQRKDGKRGAWTHNEWVTALRIEIPHWDFEARPIEELAPEDEAYAIAA